MGSLAGHNIVPRPLLDIADESLRNTRDSELIQSFYVFNAGDDLELLMTHAKGVDSEEVHRLAWDTFNKAAERAKKLKLYGAGQDLLKDAFSGNVKWMGTGVAEMEFEERRSDPVVVFAADKTEPAAFNYLLYKVFADPFSTAGLVIDPQMSGGFEFEVLDAIGDRKVVLKTPEESYALIALIGTTGRYMVSRVWRAHDHEIEASSSTTKLSLIAGKYVGKDDPVCLVRSHSGFPALGEVVVPLLHSYLVAGWMRGSHRGPIMPVGLEDSRCTVFDGPPRLVALSLQISDGKIVSDGKGEPLIADIFADPAFDMARREALELAAALRRMGEFEPARLGPEAMEYTTLPQVLKSLEGRFEPV